MEERLTKQDLMKMYKVDRTTIEEWRRNKGLNMIEVPLTQNTSLGRSYYSGRIV